MDPNGQTPIYSLTNNAGNRFTIHPNTGVVTVLNGALLDGPASHTITVQASDGIGGTSSANFGISVGNVAPSIALSGAPTEDEGSLYTLNLGAVTDPGTDTITKYIVHWGDGTNSGLINGNPANTTATHTFADGPANQINNVTVTDEDGTFLAGSLSVLVLNVAPTVRGLLGDTTVDESGVTTHTYSYSISDPGVDTVQSVSVSCGASGTLVSGSENHSDTAGSFACQFLDGPASPAVSASATDSDGDTGNTAELAVTVNNVEPTVTGGIFSLEENKADGTIVGSASATDPGVDTVSFAITGGNAGGAFAIDASSGQITVANSAAVDFETTPVFNLTVEATDSDEASGSALVTINLLNVTATISGTVYVDADNDGLFDGGTESAIDGVIVELLNGAGGLLDSDVTSMGGVYGFIVDEEFATYRIRETQPTGVNNGAAILGDAAVDSVISANEMQLTLAGVNASDYDFTEVGQAVQAGDTATIGFWQNKNGQALINQGGAPLVTWLNANFGNIVGDTFSNGSGGDNAAEVASFYKNEFFNKKLQGTSKVDAQFMATALATFFTSSNLSGGNVAASYGFNVTTTGIGTKVVNVGANGAAFAVANNTNMTIMAMLLATNSLTGADSDTNASEDYSNVYDTNGDGVLDTAEKALRAGQQRLYGHQ